MSSESVIFTSLFLQSAVSGAEPMQSISASGPANKRYSSGDVAPFGGWGGGF